MNLAMISLMRKQTIHFTFTIVISILMLPNCLAVDGIWLPILLKQLNEAEMRSMGMKMSAEDIYSVNKGSLKDAIALFGSGCTAEVISPNGLLMTNYHCSNSIIQAHSSIENNYLKNGFWAKSGKEELVNDGLQVTFIVSMQDVTKDILNGVNDQIPIEKRQELIEGNIKQLQTNFRKEEWQGVIIRPFYKGNQYYLFVTETYTDVRLVGAPPSSMGNFGEDTDNWVWPRHTADFALFRIYADDNNHPSAYSPNNKPYQPKHYLPISTSGVQEGDFTMVMGFPGVTNEYLPASAINQIYNLLNPARIALRTQTLAILKDNMQKDEKVKIQYTAKYSRIANAWKKWQGEQEGLRKSDAIGKKMKYEEDFNNRLLSNKDWQLQYDYILPKLDMLYKESNNMALAREYWTEISRVNVELFQFVSRINTLMKETDEQFPRKRDEFLKYAETYFKNYNADIDKEVFAVNMNSWLQNVENFFAKDNPQVYILKQKNGTYLAQDVYSKTSLLTLENTSKLLSGNKAEVIQNVKNDIAWLLFDQINQLYAATITNKLSALESNIQELQRLYMKAQLDVFKDKRFYPDANSTLRVTYGNVKPYQPRDGVTYTEKTYLDGVIEKYIPNDYEYDVPAKLLELYKAKDFGKYAEENGKMPVAFIGTNHTTGGNSGSPAIDAYGNLIGLNFDRVWEGTMSDLNFDEHLCRNIMVDIRYILFIIDKYAEANYLIDEMKLVKTNKKSRKNNSRR
ncbi:MAG: S46 family peptidase [Saprospiraceae bacterium]|nr:S46 family peptidase [Saprospiraceae bacterium]